MSGTNGETLRSYAAHLQDYIDGTAQRLSGPSRDWVDRAVAGLPLSARLLELGSAFGRDATYLESLGYKVECSDAVEGFVALLRRKGFNARFLNLLTDDPGGPYDLILANAVFLHFTEEEFSGLLRRLAVALASGGRLAFSLKAGQGEGWSSAKLGAPRYFRYWTPESLEPLMARSGLADWSVWSVRTERAHADWLYVIAGVR